MEINNNSENDNSNFEQEPNLDELVNSLPSFDTNSIKEPEVVPEKQKSSEYKTDSLLFHFLSIFGIIFLSVFFVFGIYLTPITVVGESMLPNINKKTTSATDTSHCDVVYYRKKESYNHGDIIIISNETSHYIDNSKLNEPVEFLIKRVIACPGDTITFHLDYSDGNKYYYKIIVKDKNGNEIELNEDSYIYEKMVIYKITSDFSEYSGQMKNIANAICDGNDYSIKISDNCYFAMGDNRNNSTDSRYFGEININDICGNVRIQVEHGDNIWIAIFKKIKSYLSVTIIQLKENL